MKSSVHIACLMLALVLPGLDGLKSRLVRGTSLFNGRLEIFYNETWSTVCNRKFGAKEAKVACRMLGFNSSRALAVRTSMYGRGFGPILLDNVQCKGSEETLMQCRHNGLYNNGCGHEEDLGVICSNQPEELRLAGTPPDIPGMGRVEIHLGGEWYTMCIPEDNVSTVVCRQLGLPFKSAVPLRKFLLGPLKKPKLLTSLKCKGHEHSVIECYQTSNNNSMEVFFSCTSESDYYGVSCGNSPSIFIQLKQGPYPAMEGTNITLECITEHALTNYTWKSDAGGLANESNLTINNLTRNHNGTEIMCLAVSRDGVPVSSNTVNLKVYYKPVIRIYWASSRPILVFSQHYEVTRGQNVIFSCEALSNPPPSSITWSGRMNSTTHELHVLEADQTKHNGVYTCTVVTGTVKGDNRLPLMSSYQLELSVGFLGKSIPTELETVDKVARFLQGNMEPNL